VLRIKTSLVLAAALGIMGCSKDNDNPPDTGSDEVAMPLEARTVFENASNFELYRLDPSPTTFNVNDKQSFHGWKILGKTAVKGEDVKAIWAAVKKGIKDSDGKVAACFNPRHGIRIVQDKKTYDFVICFECLTANIYKDDVEIGQYLTTNSPAAVLNRVLRAAKVPMRAEAKE